MMKVLGFVCALQFVTLVAGAGIIPQQSSSKVSYSIGRNPTLSLITNTDRSQTLVSSDSDEKVTYRIPVLYTSDGIPYVYDHLSGTLYYVSTDAKNQVIVKQLYVDSAGTKAIKNSNSANGFSALTVANNKVTITDYIPTSSVLPAATNYGLKPIKHSVSRSVITDANGNKMLVTTNKDTFKEYIDHIIINSKTSFPLAFSSITGQAYLVHRSQTTKEIQLFALATDSYNGVNYMATSLETGETSYVEMNSSGYVVFSSAPSKSMPPVMGPYGSVVTYKS